MINVLFVNHTAQVSGAEKVLLNLLSYFDTNTVKPIVVCPQINAKCTWISTLVNIVLNSYSYIICKYLVQY